MRNICTALVCTALILGPSGCATQSAPPITTAPVEQSETRFEVTPGVAAATGATLVVALGITALIACGIACAN